MVTSQIQNRDFHNHNHFIFVINNRRNIDAGVQWEPQEEPVTAGEEQEDEATASSFILSSSHDTSSDFVPSQSTSGSSSCEEASDDDKRKENVDDEDLSLHKEKKFIVFHSQLKELLSLVRCPNCGGMDTEASLSKTSGTMAFFLISCANCSYVYTWRTQPYVGSHPAGNIVMSAAVLFAGAGIAKFLRVLNHMGVLTISSPTFFRHQKSFLFNAVKTVWTQQQTALLAALADENGIVIGGDGRADSPGHSAKYGSYTVIELRFNKIIAVELVQVCYLFICFLSSKIRPL